MHGVRSLALFNLIIISINFIWILVVDANSLFGTSLFHAFNVLPTHLTPADFTFKAWLLIAVTMIIVAVLMYRETGNEHLNIRSVRKVMRVDYMLILNQLFCGLSMVLKLNHQMVLSVIFTIACIITILIVNNRVEIEKLTANSFTKYFIRLAFGLYTGWLMFVFAFNVVTTFVKNELVQSETEQYTIDLIFLVLSFGFAMYYSYIKMLPSVSAAFSWGLFGVIYQNINYPNYQQHNILIPLYILFGIGLMISLYNFYRCNSKRTAINLAAQANSTSIP
ncbi:hypothetical protein GQF61_03200 [Sphingobacterium sp. DK4209]|uniref:Uncharacterized protein n=1 Tax=Sphingobacterium zhuxiongii TaxID=2662364 RepID=A0A5Q0QDD1_9SPHI|nr:MULTISPECIES: hypothetical protein [unclassified Sphingobacterium]MVZ64844.1 hypothetical protein [Sphingobacterium sp. DK4209]QGA25190.1 hypothetical protein GFH32_02160 [Sphingobacterium sp. dk4302]